MCGFFAIINNTFDIDRNQLVETTKHRGKNASNIFEFDNNIFTFNLLNTTDTNNKSSLQPMISKNTGNMILFNGEVYNFQYLKKKYLNNHFFQSNTDTEVLLYLYDLFGANFINELNGDYAILIFDKIQNKFIAFRDRNGTRPLFYTIINKTFFIASEINSILKIIKNIKTTKIDTGLIQQYLSSNLLSLNDKTFFSDIYPIKPGYYYEIMTDGNIKSKIKYWDIDQFSLSQKYESNQKIYEEFDFLINDSVNLRSKCIYDEYFLTLSGGYDSQIISNYLLKNSQKKISTISYIGNNLESDNIKNYIQYRKPNFNKSYFISDNEISYENLINDASKISDIPIPDGSKLINLHICKYLNSFNAQTVLFTGDFGDELYYGFDTHFEKFISKKIKKLNLSYLFKNKYIAKLENKSLIKQILISFLSLKIKNKIKNIIFDQSIFKPNIKSNTNYFKLFDTDDSKNEYHNILNNYLTYHIDINDKLAARNNIIVRTPLNDFRLQEFIMRIEPEYHFLSGPKSIIKNNLFSEFEKYKDLREKKISFPSGINKYLKNNFLKLSEKSETYLNHLSLFNRKYFQSSINRDFNNNDLRIVFRKIFLIKWLYDKSKEYNLSI